MANQFSNIDEEIGDDKKYITNQDGENTYSKNSQSSITKTIGSGEDAKNSVIWHVIFTTFCIFSCIVASLIIIDLYRTKGEDTVQIVKDIWSIFTPILTLSLGYMFGTDSVKRKLKTPSGNKKSESNQPKQETD